MAGGKVRRKGERRFAGKKEGSKEGRRVTGEKRTEKREKVFAG